jgi:hypothetical protein
MSRPVCPDLFVGSIIFTTRSGSGFDPDKLRYFKK